MRYELRLTAFDMLDQIHVSAVLYGGDAPLGLPTERVWAMTATSRGRGTLEATEWTREALETMLAAL